MKTVVKLLYLLSNNEIHVYPLNINVFRCFNVQVYDAIMFIPISLKTFINDMFIIKTVCNI